MQKGNNRKHKKGKKEGAKCTNCS